MMTSSDFHIFSSRKLKVPLSSCEHKSWNSMRIFSEEELDLKANLMSRTGGTVAGVHVIW
jgi:hypothetical protein